jgi:hypothetical protein
VTFGKGGRWAGLAVQAKWCNKEIEMRTEVGSHALKRLLLVKPKYALDRRLGSMGRLRRAPYEEETTLGEHVTI